MRPGSAGRDRRETPVSVRVSPLEQIHEAECHLQFGDELFRRKVTNGAPHLDAERVEEQESRRPQRASRSDELAGLGLSLGDVQAHEAKARLENRSNSGVRVRHGTQLGAAQSALGEEVNEDRKRPGLLQGVRETLVPAKIRHVMSSLSPNLAAAPPVNQLIVFA